jgi:3-oxoacyl-[acyl-carrier protein] reductase
LSEKRVALIIGGASGIGRQIVLAFAKRGYNIAFSYNTDELKAKEVETKVKELGVECIYIKVNVTNEQEILTAKERILTHYAKIDVLINNAGIFEDGLVKKMNLDSWQRVLDVNLTGVLLCIKSFIDVMEKRQYGRIINIGSIVGEIGTIGAGNYSASKAGLIGLTKTVAREVAKKGITANVVSLGYIDEGMGKRLPEKLVNKVIEQIPMNKFGSSEKVSEMIVHLASDEAEYITGQVIGINGGLNM